MFSGSVHAGCGCKVLPTMCSRGVAWARRGGGGGRRGTRSFQAGTDPVAGARAAPPTQRWDSTEREKAKEGDLRRGGKQRTNVSAWVPRKQ